MCWWEVCFICVSGTGAAVVRTEWEDKLVRVHPDCAVVPITFIYICQSNIANAGWRAFLSSFAILSRMRARYRGSEGEKRGLLENFTDET